MSAPRRTVTETISRWIVILALSIGVALLTGAFLDWIGFGSYLFIGARQWD